MEKYNSLAYNYSPTGYNLETVGYDGWLRDEDEVFWRDQMAKVYKRRKHYPTTNYLA